MARALVRLVVSLAVVVAAASAWGGPLQITFAFDIPGDRVQFTQELVTKRTRDMGEVGRVVDSSESTVQITIERRPDGFLLTAEPVAFRMVRDGKEIDDPIVARLQSLSCRYVLDRDGGLLRVEGLGEALEAIFSGLPEGLSAILRQQLSEKALIARETAEWNGRIGDFIGLTVSVGEVLESVAPFQLPDGETIEYLNSYAFPRTVPCGGARCVEVVHTYTSDAAAVARYASRVAQAVSGATGEELQAGSSGAAIRGSAWRLVEPETLRIHEERLERTIEMTVDVPGRGPVRTITSETRDYRFRFE